MDLLYFATNDLSSAASIDLIALDAESEYRVGLTEGWVLGGCVCVATS